MSKGQIELPEGVLIGDPDLCIALPILLRPQNLARWLQVSERTIRRKRSAHQLPEPVTVAGQPRWLAQDILEYLDRQRPSGSRALGMSGLGLPRLGNTGLDSQGQAV